MSQAAEPTRPISLSRRRALSTLAVAAATTFGGSVPASAWSLFGRSKASVESTRLDVSGLSDEWVRRQGSELGVYADYLSRAGFRHLTPLQVIEAHAKSHGGVWNSLPPRDLWDNLVPTLRVIDRVSVELGQPVQEIISAYRSPAYNARCPGASSGSWHQQNFAVDVRFKTRASVVASTARRLRGQGLFQGGIGRYPTFTHIDTRGQSVDW
ncbi:hypothetical protein HNR46_003859 [Haloferula luteola]|uniref:Peptidase M15A C-terminal domain-containing protein n=1 Tax=Haloferula luteola TaxID=595692 RepID=A0A840VG71_9BACT|nr:D-Ala-D-Ala carboxypeptidase family metallohydrolase [Haloferula luteola]MBB5353598.1 hypothetical protein [Haloferula luteola]